MTKMQIEHDEKQKRRKLRKQQMEKLEMSQSTGELKGSSGSSNNQPVITPKSERKFLSSIMNTLFSSTSNSNNNNNKDASHASESNAVDANENSSTTMMSKSEAKRLSLKRLKAKDKAKKKGPNNEDDDECGGRNNELNYQSDTEVQNATRKVSTSSLDLNQLKFKTLEPQSSVTRFGKIKNEITAEDRQPINGNKENIMKQLKAELDEEIKG